MSASLEYLPKDFWGLDPVHRAYAKLYIADILQIQPYPGGEGNVSKFVCMCWWN